MVNWVTILSSWNTEDLSEAQLDMETQNSAFREILYIFKKIEITF